MKQTTHYTIITHALLGLLLTVFSIGIPAAPQAGASERTGRIISEIVNSLDSEMEKLESFVEQNKNDTDSLNRALDNRFDAFNKADNTMDVQRIQADILLYSARLNACNIKEIGAYMDTVASLIPMMNRLNGEYRKLANHGFESQTAYNEFKGHVGNQLINAGRMIQQMKKMSDSRVLKGIPALERSVLSLSNMFGDTGIKQFEESEPFRDRIADLENTYALFEATRQQLEKERFLLKHDNLAQLARLGMLRLTQGKINVKNINDIPLYMQESIDKRRQRYMEIMHADKARSSAEDPSEPSSANDEIIARIAAGNPFNE